MVFTLRRIVNAVAMMFDDINANRQKLDAMLSLFKDDADSIIFIYV